MRVVYDHVEEEATNIRTFFFRSEQPLDYTAGQFTELTISHDQPDDRGSRRWFTLSSAPGSELFSITTKYAGDDRSSSFKQALFGLRPGTELRAAEPMGDFVLPKLIQTPLIFVAGGIGVTPFHSMFEWLADTGEARPIKFLYAVRNEEEIIFQPTFERADVHATIVVSDPSAAWGGERGHLDARLILGLEQPSEDALIYISGPEPMVETLKKDLKQHGVQHRQLVTDDFPNYTGI